MNDNKRRKELQTVESLVIIIVHDPNLTRKELMDRMTGKGFPEENRPNELNGISRQSVYKALDFLFESGILVEKSDHIIFRINRYTIKSVTLSINIDQVWRLHSNLLIERYLERKDVISQSDTAKQIIKEYQKKHFEIMRIIDTGEDAELMNLYLKNPLENEEIITYLHLKKIEIIMDYLRLFSMKAKAVNAKRIFLKNAKIKILKNAN